jgi:hypothetical protein
MRDSPFSAAAWEKLANDRVRPANGGRTQA